MSPRPLRPAAIRAAIALVWVAASVVVLDLLLWSDGVPAPVGVESSRVFDPAKVAADSSYRTGLRVAGIALTLLASAVAIAIAATRRRWANRVLAIARSRTWAAGAVLGVGIAVATAVVAVPIQLWRHWWVNGHGVGRQPLGSFVGDLGQSALVGAGIAAVTCMLIAVAVIRLPRTWWLALGAGVATLAAALTMLGPVVIAPLFESTTPLTDRALVADVRELGRAAGVDVGEVLVSDASRRSRIVNARVEGLFGTQRVVLDDTLTDTPRDQIRWVVAHEFVHVARNHVVKGVVWAIALVLPLALLVSACVAAVCGPARAERGSDVVGRTAVAFAAVTVLLVLATPVQNWVSRAVESEADWGAIQLTRAPDAAIAHRVLARDLARADPDPPRVLHLWFGTHPTPLERVGLVERWRLTSGADGPITTP